MLSALTLVGTGKCWHEVQLVDVISVRNWEEAALALSLMQSVVFNLEKRIGWLVKGEGDAILKAVASSAPEQHMTILHEAGLTPAAQGGKTGVGGRGDAGDYDEGAGGGSGPLERPTPLSAAQAIVAKDVLALAAAGVSGASLVVPLPMPVMVDADAVSNESSTGSFMGASACTSPDTVQPLVRAHVQPVVPAIAPVPHMLCMQAFSRVYRGVWRAAGSDGTGQSVVVKVLSPPQARRETAVLSALAAHPSARAVRVLNTVRVGTNTGIITPYCPGRLFVGCTMETVLDQVVQLCEVGSVAHWGQQHSPNRGGNMNRRWMAGTPMGCSTWT